ncbi:serine protease inhibitor dipetalogastin-like [Lycorma delicatula]|uniref:serine protease inhibitor dipetalogastin-like n=1 Tax=Lycorma delicatula TaxID=130591 RepID=UPI003F515F00
MISLSVAPLVLCFIARTTSLEPLLDKESNLKLAEFYSDCSSFDDHRLFGGHVCGDDGITYANVVYLSCINFWLPKEKEVKIAHKGPCLTNDTTTGDRRFKGRCLWSPIYKPVCGSDSKTYANIEALQCKNVINPELKLTVLKNGECSTKDPCVTAASHPAKGSDSVCASNGHTYAHIDQVRCLRNYHSSLDVVHSGGCSATEVTSIYPSRAEVCALAQGCFEWNPVCGRNNVTYINPYVFSCYAPHMEMKFMGECSDEKENACILAKIIESCGSDGLSHMTIYHLMCSSKKDKYLTWLHDGECSPDDDPCLQIMELQDEGQPVCGMDGVTYVSTNALWCISSRKDRRKYSACSKVKISNLSTYMMEAV